MIICTILVIACTFVAIIIVSWNLWLEKIPELSKILADVKTNPNLNGWFKIIFNSSLISGSLFAIRNLLGITRDLIASPKIDFTQYLDHPNYEEQVAFVEKFHEDFSKIVNSYVGENQKVYVFIDDIDRCELDKSADLLQALNMMISNDPNIIFILGMDRENIAAAITFKQRDILPFLASAIAKNQTEENEDEKLSKKVDYGFSFLEKFVQLSFSVPTPSQNNLDSFVEKILEIQEETKASPEKQEKYFLEIMYSLIKILFSTRKILILVYSLISSISLTNFNPRIYWRRLKYSIEKIWNDTKIKIIIYSLQIYSRQEEKNYILQQLLKRTLGIGKKLESLQKTLQPPDLPIFPIIEKDLDQENLKLATRMVAPFFDYNPRRLKQYINLLKLRIYIAYYSIGVTFDERETITIEQIAKFTAITLQYPRLILELKNNHQILYKLEKDAVDKSIQSNNSTILSPTYTNNQETGNANYWLNNYPKIKQLLSSKIALDDQQKSDKKYTFENGSIKKLLEVSPQGIPPKYFRLREFLAAKNWKEADDETYRVMLEVGGKDLFLNVEHIERFPCKDLHIIDQLWVKYSNEKFGFSIQKKIYQSLGGTREYNKDIYKEFRKKVGWRKEGWLNYSEELFSEKYIHYVGHLPSWGWYRVVRRPSMWDWLWSDGGWVRGFFSRAETCRL